MSKGSRLGLGAILGAVLVPAAVFVVMLIVNSPTPPAARAARRTV
jgi:hypothetical protein